MELTLFASSLGDWLAGAGNVLKVIAGLGFVIFVHELGHFLAAKACGVKCEKFYVGFDVPIKLGPIRLPKTLGKFQWGETEYGIGIIPLGGYVKMLGQEDNPSAQAEANEKIKVVDDEGQEQLDPRSFQAKTVGQRMVIISAGVIMNVIFAVVMAAVAYKMGVPHQPTDIAGTSPGDPAWVLGIQSDDKIIQMSKAGTPSENLRFLWDLRQSVAKAGINEKRPVTTLDFLIRRGDAQQWYAIVGSERLRSVQRGMVSIGVRPLSNTKLSAAEPVRKDSAASKATPEFEPGDRIIAVDGEALRVDEETAACYYHDVEQLMFDRLNEPITFTVERTAEDGGVSKVDITVPPEPMLRFGLVMSMGPVAGIQAESPAASSDFKVGDVIKTIDGQPVGDPLTLAHRFRAKIGSTVRFEVERKLEKSEKTELVEVELTTNGKQHYYPIFANGCRLALDPLGIAFEVSPLVSKVLPNTPAAEAGIQEGDVVTSYKVALTDEALATLKKKYKKKELKEYLAPHELDDVYNWLTVHAISQQLKEGHSIELTYKRGEESKSIVMSPVEIEGLYRASRGLQPTAFERVHIADSWGEAVGLGFRETKERIQDVFGILKMLFSGDVGVNKLSGPLGIVRVASAEASQGIPRLLIFLTLLSANLAILNFLPIPVLDGGHFAFLLWELVRGKPASERVQLNAQMIGFIALISLILYVTWNDIFSF